VTPHVTCHCACVYVK